MSPGTLDPLLHNVEFCGLLGKEEKTVEEKVRKYYKITKLGWVIL
ncbi:helix-turn-helix transcriptional regulator [Clostridium botulinum]|nr:(R)-2-hydroxyglutaryl-CoA dehydratase subunit beta [Clostridium botulinum Bf]